MSFSSTFLTWLPIPTSQIPGRLLGYRIRYREYHSDVTKTFEVAPTMNMRTLVGLNPFKFYWVEITGYTSAGEGPKRLVVFQTPPGRKLISTMFVVTILQFVRKV